MMEDYKTWKVGDEVECIYTFKMDGANDYIYPKKGKRYHIRDIRIYPNDKIGLILTEIKNKNHQNTGREPAFMINKFRKLQKRKTDISQFTAMLNQTLLTNQIELTVKERIPENV